MLTMSRPAVIESDEHRLGQEYASALWTHHRLLDFEDLVQRELDAAAERIAPGIVRIDRILFRLARRAKRAAHTSPGTWAPNPRPELAATLRARRSELGAQRNADPRWKTALAWADTPAEDAPERGGARRRAGESDDQFAERCASRRDRLTRREAYRAALYAERRIYWGTWNALVRSVDQARRDVIKRRKQGLPAEIRRPRFHDPLSLAADSGGFRVVERDVCGPRGGAIWWVVDVRIGLTDEWVRVRAKLGNWHAVPADARIRTAKLTRRQDGERRAYTLGLTVDVAKPTEGRAASGMIAFDWGHREHGHDRSSEGIRAWTWRGDDGATGEILIPAECRALIDHADAMRSRVDSAYDARQEAHGLLERNRHTYRRRLMRDGVRREEEAVWLRWEMRWERRMTRCRQRVQDLRRETYLRAIRDLRQRYGTFAFEAEVVSKIKTHQKEEERPRRQRANRDLATRYEFVELCEQFGADVIPVPARNTTRECPTCGVIGENGPELFTVCPSCGTARDKDYGATRIILRRAQEALANRAA